MTATKGLAPGAAHRGRVFAMPFGEPFLEGLARAIISGDLPHLSGQKISAIDLPGITLLMPTRRAERALGDAFLKVSGAGAVLLPQIRAVSDRDETETYFSRFSGADAAALLGTGGGLTGADGAQGPLPPPIAPISRQMVLMALVKRWSEALAQGRDPLGPVTQPGARTPAQAAALARELGGLLDLVETEGVSLDPLADLVPDGFSEHWEQTLSFLEIITQFWPAHREAIGGMTAAERRNALIRGEAERLRRAPPDGPVIVAGITGSIPATVELMQAVLSLESGAIVLPGFDADMSLESWSVLRAPVVSDAERDSGRSPVGLADPSTPRDHPEHPQFGLRRLLDKLGLRHGDVALLNTPDRTSPLTLRGAFVSEAMRPTGTTDHWHSWLQEADREAVRAGLADVHLIEASGAIDEAEAVALILREAVEDPKTRIALVTPDRLLARRIAIRLAAWGVRVDDSAGRPFAKTVPGAFLNLTIEAIHQRFAPASLMALLKHPLCRVGLPARDVRLAARALELLAFRTVYAGEGLQGVRAALKRVATAEAEDRRLSAPARRLSDDERAAAHDLVDRLEEAFAPLTALYQEGQPVGIDALVTAHTMAAETLSAVAEAATATLETVATLPGAADAAPAHSEDVPEEPSPLYRGEAGQAASDILGELISAGAEGPDIAARDYADLYRALVGGHNVLPRVPVHPQISILGVMEARLIDADVMILSGLNDGTWPDHADPGPWLNRPMRSAIGLPALEEKIGYAAHDFTSFLAAPKVYMTRAKKVDGVPTVASRWLLRIKALLEGLDLSDALDSDQPWLAWASQRDAQTAAMPAISAPQPCPPLEARPRKIGVSRVETWIANPYAIFAERILKLERLPDLGHEPDAALRGMIVHAALYEFTKRHGDRLPEDIAAEIMRAAHDHFDDLRGSPRVWAFWRPRLQRFAHWFSETEPARRDGVIRSFAEVNGRLDIGAPGGLFTLTARADRIDVVPTGIVITDYKTGKAPSKPDVEKGKKPQLPLEAAIAAADGFGLAARDFGDAVGGNDLSAVRGLRYISATGAEPAGEDVLIAAENVGALAEQTLENLSALIARFDDPATPYAALRRAGFSYDYDDYAHLARIDEWAFGGSGGGLFVLDATTPTAPGKGQRS